MPPPPGRVFDILAEDQGSIPNPQSSSSQNPHNSRSKGPLWPPRAPRSDVHALTEKHSYMNPHSGVRTLTERHSYMNKNYKSFKNGYDDAFMILCLLHQFKLLSFVCVLISLCSPVI